MPAIFFYCSQHLFVPHFSVSYGPGFKNPFILLCNVIFSPIIAPREEEDVCVCVLIKVY